MKLLAKITALCLLFALQYVFIKIIPSFPYKGILADLLGFVLFLSVSNLILTIVVYVYRKRKKLLANESDNIVYGLNNIYYIIVFFAFCLTLLRFWGLDVKTVFTSLSIVAAAIAIISKDYISSVISGIIISFSKELAIKDYVKIGEHKGTIVDINLAKIALINDDDDVIYIPNEKVYASEIINYTKREVKKIGIEFDMNLNAIESVADLEQKLSSALSDYKDHIVEDGYNLKVVTLASDHIKFKFQYVLKEMNQPVEQDIRKKTIRKVVDFVKSVNRNLLNTDESESQSQTS